MLFFETFNLLGFVCVDMSETVDRSWGTTIHEHWLFLVVFLISGPLAIFYSIGPFGYWVVNRGDSATSIDAFRIGLMMFVYGVVMLFVLF